MIRLTRLAKRFGAAIVLRDITLDIGSGEAVALWGANGAGKTTIIRCICGLHDFQGQIVIGGIDAAARGKLVRQHIGYVPQSCGLPADMRVHGAVEFFAALRNVKDCITREALARVGLDRHAHKRVGQLSGGMKQRLSLAIALLGHPPVLLLDEVTANLDVQGRHELIELLTAIARDAGRTILFASHRLDEIAAIASRVAVIESGVVVQDLPVARFLAAQHPDTMLHLFMDHLDADRAISLLAQHGFDAQLNGRGILVPVRSGERMAPIRLLQQRDVQIVDFEIIDTESQGSDS